MTRAICHVAAEVEVFAEVAGEPADFRHWCPGQFEIASGESKFSGLTTDAAPDLLEFISSPQTSGAAISRELSNISRQCPSDWTFRFEALRSCPWPGGTTPWMPKPRYQALRESIRRENPATGYLVEEMTNCAATQLHLEIGPDTPAGTALLSFLDHIGPYAARVFSNRYQVDNRRHLAMWDFALTHRRSPGLGNWYASSDAMRDRFTSIRRLIRRVESGEQGSWDTSPTDFQVWGEPDDEKNNWPFCRARVAYGTLEFRPLPSLPFPFVGEVADEILAGANAFLERVDGPTQSPDDLAGLFSALNQYFAWVPASPLTAAEREAYIYATDLEPA